MNSVGVIGVGVFKSTTMDHLSSDDTTSASDSTSLMMSCQCYPTHTPEQLQARHGALNHLHQIKKLKNSKFCDDKKLKTTKFKKSPKLSDKISILDKQMELDAASRGPSCPSVVAKVEAGLKAKKPTSSKKVPRIADSHFLY